MEYQVICLSDFDEFIQKVNELLANGWAVSGGIATAVYHFKDRNDNLDSTLLYLQAMVRNI